MLPSGSAGPRGISTSPMTKSSYGHVVTKQVPRKVPPFFKSPDLQPSRVTSQHASSVRENQHTFDHERPRPRRDSGARPYPASRATSPFRPSPPRPVVKKRKPGVAALSPDVDDRARARADSSAPEPSRRRSSERWTDPVIAFLVIAQAEEKKEETPAPAPIFGFGATGGFGGAAATFDPTAFASAPKAAAADADDEAADAAAAGRSARLNSPLSSSSSRWLWPPGRRTRTSSRRSPRRTASSRARKERGLGPIKLLKDKDSGKIRLLMRREKTLKICANFHVKPGTKIEEHAGSDKARVMVVTDCSDGDVRPTMVNMCVKFGSAEKAATFQEEFEKAMEHMKQFEGQESAEKKEGDEAADALADDLAAKAKADSADEKKEEA